ncbi:uncharacterized protein H6S33_004677 [Morchella sextelata]|uniref:uncharacterized protein n=1 Tax=Morchella sextelata TaxID=1174677 RepID=UPI001D05847A|nr:uncharacterized protein H6S33_004677 [Morchella sextelata]KAH0605455.1 hypothetical protein H6S33_004677 [Morchella sextelata]
MNSRLLSSSVSCCVRRGARPWALPVKPAVNWSGWRLYSSVTAEVKAKSAEKPYYVTTPIFYVNAAPHVGHLYSMVITDVLKRWQQLQGRTAVLCTGTDEHGMKIQQAALAANTPPKQFCDSGAEVFKSLAQQADISYDHFIRTTDQKHYDAVQHIWDLLADRGLIYTGKHAGWYSVSDETFYPESSVKQILSPTTGRKTMISTETGQEVEWAEEINYHFKLSAMRENLLDFYAKNPDFIVPAARYKAVVDEVTSGLSDLSISRPRSRLTWGIPVPSNEEQTIYVWLDALVNYITVTGYPWTPGKELVGGWPADVHVVGKDIVRFHCIYWPAFLLALDLPLPKQILTHAHWTMNQKKMSKSVGNVVDPFYAMKRYGVDTMRFYMAHDGGIVDDGDYSNREIINRYQSILQGGLGNLVNRVCSKTFDLEAAIALGVDSPDLEMTEADQQLQEAVETVGEKVAEKMAKFEVPGALKEIVAVISKTNKYVSESAPWALKDPSLAAQRHKIIYLSSEAVRVSGILLRPFMPTKMSALLDQLSVAADKRGFEYASFGKDRTYGVGSSGRKAMLFPPLNEEVLG